MTTFKSIGLSENLLRVLSEIGFETPSPIQEKAIPALLQDHTDFIGLAQTGTGKTAAFGLPLLEAIDPSNNSTQALVLAPTRELGRQIAEQFNIFSKYLKKINVLAVYGGAPIVNQIKALKKPQHVIIATPGRLIDLIKRKSIQLHELEILVLDEADEMLNMGFKEELDKILEYTPEEKQTWLFSATMPPDIRRIVAQYMTNPIEIRTNTENKVNVNIDHQFVVVRQADKFEALTRFIDLDDEMRGVVFCRTKRDTQNLAEALLKRGYKADSLHGDLSQPQRDRVMKRFKVNALQVLIATDVAARGIDVSDLTHVFHFALPDDNSYYTHRSGRTARAGKKGVSISFIGHRELYRIRKLERQLKIDFEKISIPQAEEIAQVRLRNWCTKILSQQPKQKLSKALMNEAELIFGGLTKEELLAKVLSSEFEKLNTQSARDLNDTLSPTEKPRRRNERNRRRKRFENRRGGSGGGRRSEGGRRHRKKKKK